MKNTRLTLAPAALLAGVSLLSAAHANEGKDEAAIRQAIASRYPEVQVTDIHPSPVPGIYSVMSADSVVYSDRTGDYLFVGPLVETKTKMDLSKQALDERDSIDFSQLPLDKAIKTVRGSGERTLAVFADPDCPYCHNLEKELAGLGDVTIYTFLYPLTSLHPDAKNKARAIWCAVDRSATWHDWMILDKAAPAPAADCGPDPLDELAALGTRLKIMSTPVLFTENGHRVSGARSAAEINALLAAAHADKLRAATSSPKNARS